MSTVATAVSDELQLPPVPVVLNCVVLPAHTFCVPLIVPAFGAAVTVTVLVAVALAHGAVPVTV